MTKSRNFPHVKAARQLNALERLRVQLKDAEEKENEYSIRRIKKEISVLENRTKSGVAHRSTKKVHANTGRHG